MANQKRRWREESEEVLNIFTLIDDGNLNLSLERITIWIQNEQVSFSPSRARLFVDQKAIKQVILWIDFTPV